MLLPFLLSLAAVRIWGASTTAVNVTDRAVARASDSFGWTGINMDFWPSSKAKWEGVSALDVDLDDPLLRMLARGLSGALLRLGGSPADFLVYDVFEGACSASSLNRTQPVGKGYFCPIWDQAQGRCLTMQRWQALLQFAADAGLSLVMDLNACWLRNSSTTDTDFSMVEGLLAATAAARSGWGAALWGVEWGNEVYSNIAPQTYGDDVARLRARLNALWAPPGPPPPRVMGPDAWENDLSPAYYQTMLTASGGGLHAVTFHDYGDDCCTPTNGDVLNVTCLDALFATPAWVRDIAAAHGVQTWNGEGALHAMSGVSGLTNTFLSSLYYLHALGSYAAGGISLFSRQTLIGGDYELLNRTTFHPTPDYFALLLFRRLVGPTALAVGASGGVRAHAFCSLQGSGSVVVVLINFQAAAGAAASVAWPTPPPAGAVGALYALSGVAGWGDAQEQAQGDWFRVALNNATLALSAEGALPALEPVSAPLDAPLWLPPASAALLVWDGAGAQACA